MASTPRSSWKGSISFGMVSIPTKMYVATEEKAVKFNQLHAECGARIRMLKRCESGHDVSGMSEIVKGYEATKDQYVVVTDEDLEKLPLASKREIAIERFVPEGSVPVEQYAKTYFVSPEDVGERGYVLLVKAMENKKVAGVAKLAFRDTREHMALLRAVEGRLMLHTLHWPDEVRAWPFEAPVAKPAKNELDMAKLLVENLSGTYDPTMFTDDYREAVHELIDAKLAGTTPKTLPAAKAPAADLMEALKASVAKNRKAS